MLLEALRKRKRGVFGLLIVGFCGALMLPFGLDMMQTKNPKQDSAIKVNDTKLDARQFYNRLQQIQESYRSQLKENYPAFRKMLNLEQRTADDLVHGVLLDNYIEKVGLGAGLTQIEEKIASHPFFKEGGINKSSFETFLRIQGLNSAALESITKREILVQQLETLFSDFAKPSKKEEESIKRLNSRVAKFKYLEFKPESFKSAVKTDDSQILQSYFKDHSDNYMTKRAVGFSAVAFPPQEFITQVKIEESELKDAYEQDQNIYFSPAQVKIKQYAVNKDRFVTNVDPKKKNEQDLISSAATAKEFINKADIRLKAGEGFDKVVGQDSDQPVNSDWIDNNALEPEVKSVVSSLDLGETSGVIETEKAYKIIMLEAAKEKSKKNFEEVKSSIEAKLKSENAPEYARAAAENFVGKIEKNNISEISEKNGKKIINTPHPISAGEILPGITPAAVKEILSMQEGTVEVVNDGDTSYVVQVNKVEIPEVPKFEKVADKVKEDVIAKESMALATKAAEQARDKLIKGEPFEEFAKSNNLQVSSSDFISKDKPATAAPFTIDNNKAIALGLSSNNPVAKQIISEGGAQYVIALQEEKQEENKEEKKQQEPEQVGANRLFESLIKYLKSKAEISIDPSLLEANS